MVSAPAMPEPREWRVVSRRGRERVVSGFAGEIRKKFADANFNYTFLTPNSSFLTNPKLYVFYSRCCVYVLL